MLDTKDILKNGLVLATIGAVAGGLITVTMNFTAPIMEARAAESGNRAAQMVLPDAETFEKKALEDGTVYYVGTTAGKIAGYVVQTTRSGYNPGIVLLTGLDEDGMIQGIEVVSHSETKGIGTKVIESADFMEQYLGKTPGMSLTLGSDIEAISGATTTSRAINEAVRDALTIYERIIEIETE